MQAPRQVRTSILTGRNHSSNGYVFLSHTGGPSLGDIRSRLNRLAAIASKHQEVSCLSLPDSSKSLLKLLTYRLPMEGSSREIKQEWLDILEGKHKLWQGIDSEKRECVRGFLVQFESEVLHRAHRNFNFRGGSIGNFFLVAMQRFFRSIQSAIFLFSAILGIQSALPASRILPAINTNRTMTIAALLENGSTIVGQCEISHPTLRPATSLQDSGSSLVSTRQPSPEATPSSLSQNLPNEGLCVPQIQNQTSAPLTAVHSSTSDASSEHSVQEDEFSDQDMDPNDPSGNDQDFLGNLAFSKLEECEELASPIRRM